MKSNFIEWVYARPNLCDPTRYFIYYDSICVTYYVVNEKQHRLSTHADVFPEKGPINQFLRRNCQWNKAETDSSAATKCWLGETRGFLIGVSVVDLSKLSSLFGTREVETKVFVSAHSRRCRVNTAERSCKIINAQNFCHKKYFLHVNCNYDVGVRDLCATGSWFIGH